MTTRDRFTRLLGDACLLLSVALMALALVCGGPAKRAPAELCDLAAPLASESRG